MVMAKPPPYLGGDQYYMKDYFKPKYNHHSHKTKSLSFFASLLSLFIYSCVLYIFKLSPSTLFNNNIFWFLMSNTLILIIAADYGEFSSSNKQRQNLYEEYVKHSQATRKSNFYVSSYVPKYDEQCIISPKQELELGELLQEKKETLSDQIVPERVLEIVVQNNKPKKHSEFCANDEKKEKFHSDDGYKEVEEEKAIVPAARIYGRSKSDRHNYRVKKVVMEERMRRSETIKAEQTNAVEEEEENDEFSKMTNEDLNRRVEEFIQKFNKQIRIQATRN